MQTARLALSASFLGRRAVRSFSQAAAPAPAAEPAIEAASSGAGLPTQSALFTPPAAPASPPPVYIPPTNGIPMFNTYKLFDRLRSAGLTEAQSVILMDALVTATSEALASTHASLATKAELSNASVQMSEKMFNATLKYDMQQKHSREMFKSEVDATKSDMNTLRRSMDSELAAFKTEVKLFQKTEMLSMQSQLNIVEKEKSSERAFYKSEVEQLENRLIRYALALATSLSAVGLTAYRIFMIG